MPKPIEIVTVVLLAGLVFALVYLIVEIQRVRVQIDQVLGSSLGRTLTAEYGF